MTRVVIAAALAVAIVLPHAAHAQSKTDFSGAWTWLAVSGSKAKTKTLSMKIAQSPAELRIERVFEGAAPARETVIYRLDGAESSNRIGDATVRTKAAWKGGALILTSMVPTGGTPESATDVYRIVNGDLVIETTRQEASGRVTITKETFRKAQQ